MQIAGCKAFVGLDKMGIFDVKKANKHLVKEYRDLKEEKRAKKNLETANKEFAAESAKMAEKAVSGGDDEDGDKDKKGKTEGERKGQKGYDSYSCLLDMVWSAD